MFACRAVLVLILAAATASAAETREVVIGPKTDAREVSRYFSLRAHGPTQKFFVLRDVGVVVVVATSDGTSDASATIHVFPEGSTAEGIDRWINNRHSDAIYPEAAEPDRVIKVPGGKFRAKAGAVVGHEVGSGGDEYDRVPIEFTIEPFEDGDVVVRASQGTLEAFVRTKDIPGGKPARR